MIVVDVESSGMDAKLCSLLSVGALDFDNPANQFYTECFAFPGAHIEDEALEVSGFTREEITTPGLADSAAPLIKGDKSSASPARRLAGGEDLGTSFRKGGIRKSTDREAVEAFLGWMQTCKEWTIVGQNPSFDRDFLRETAHRYHLDWPLAQRTVDLHTIAYWHYLKIGKEIPRKNNHSALNLDSITLHVGLPIQRKTHNALEDAKLEAEAFCRLLKGEPLLPEYSRFPVPKMASLP